MYLLQQFSKDRKDYNSNQISHRNNESRQNHSMKKQKIMVQNITCIIPESSQAGGLFLGNIYGAQNPTVLKEYGIRAVLTLSTQTPLKYEEHKADVPFHLKIQAHDKEDYEIIQQDLESCQKFIDQKRKLTNVLVHCFAGVSRSVTIVVAYLMLKYGWNLNKALNFVKFKRCVAKPNKGFHQQLIKFQAQLEKKASKNNDLLRDTKHSGKLRKASTLNVQPSLQNGFQQGNTQIVNLRIKQDRKKMVYRQSKPSSVTNLAQQRTVCILDNSVNTKNNTFLMIPNLSATSASTSSFNSARGINSNLRFNIENAGVIGLNKPSLANQNRVVLGNYNLRIV